MRPVNLLPASERPRRAAKAPSNASVIVLATLAFLLLAVGVVVATKNQITSGKAEIATAKQRTAEAQARSSSLKSYADFRQIKQTRLQSVTELASQRFDWERFMRELALVLPDKVWLTDINGATAGAASATGGSASPAPTASTGATSSPTGGSDSAPSIKLSGCAPSHEAVATLLVRLRSLYGVDTVDLQDSSGSTAGSSSTSTSDSASSGGDASAVGCGKGYTFDTMVTFKDVDSSQSSKSKPVSPRLGGGA